MTSANRPKPFLRLFSSYSLLQKTLRRVFACADPIIVCHRHFTAKVQHDLQHLQRRARFIFAEADGRSTAASITLAALAVEPEQLILVMPSDHVMADPDKFLAQLSEAQKVAATENRVVLFGAQPRSNASRYGYILAEGFAKTQIKKVQHFVEKPEKPRAVQIRASGHCFWNTGIFLCKAGVFLDKLHRHAPEILESCSRALKAGNESGGVIMPDRDAFFRCPAIPVDVAVMEKARNIYVIDLGSRWADIGTWPSLLHAMIFRH